jgi:hypothetical protein
MWPPFAQATPPTIAQNAALHTSVGITRGIPDVASEPTEASTNAVAEIGACIRIATSRLSVRS